jgi:hypothetical protein
MSSKDVRSVKSESSILVAFRDNTVSAHLSSVALFLPHRALLDKIPHILATSGTRRQGPEACRKWRVATAKLKEGIDGAML